MLLLSDVTNARLLSVVAFEFLKELLFVGLIDNVAEISLEGIVRTEHKIGKCNLKLLLV